MADAHDDASMGAEEGACEGKPHDLVDNIPGVLIRLATGVDGATEVQYISPRCVEMLELPSHQIVGDASTLWGLIDPQDLNGLQAAIAESAQTLKPWVWMGSVTTPSGRRK